MARVGRFLKRQLRRLVRHYGYEIIRAPGAPWPRDHFAATFRPYRAKVNSSSRDIPHVLHAIGNFYTGGSPRLVVDLVERLGERFTQSILTRDVSSPPAYSGVDLDVRPWLRNLEDAVHAVSRTRPDLVHVHHIGTRFSRLGLGDWDWFATIFEALEQLDRPVIENVNIPIAPYVNDAVSRYVFVSDYAREHYSYPELPAETIYPGSDVEMFSRGVADVPDDCVGMVYRLDGDKLDEHAIDVFVEVIRKRPGTRALIVGGGPLLSHYRAVVSAAGIEEAVNLPGYVAYEDLRSFYERMSVFVAPVHHESFGHVVPLAMSMGIPVAAYAVGALPEILDDASVLAPPGDAAPLAEIVCSLLDDRDRRLALGTANRRRCVEKFSVQAMADRYADLYQELLVAHDPRRVLQRA
jgi:glycosyltransferase involved in cell wall biosynthesis